MRLKDKKIIVTAAAQGIGKATALAFAKEEANVIAIDINQEKLNDLKKENSDIDIVTLDSPNKTNVQSFASTVNEIDFLLQAVGFFHHGTI